MQVGVVEAPPPPPTTPLSNARKFRTSSERFEIEWITIVCDVRDEGTDQVLLRQHIQLRLKPYLRPKRQQDRHAASC